LAIVALGAATTDAGETAAAYVVEGAFVLEKEPNTLSQGRWVHGLIAYLPVGTVVYYEPDAAVTLIHTYPSDSKECYLEVDSELGVSGLVLRRLVVDIDRPLLVPVCNKDVVIHTRGSTNEEPRRLSSYSRSTPPSNVEVIDEDPDWYLVELPWTRSEDRSADVGKLNKSYVRRGEVVLLSPETLRTTHPRVREVAEDTQSVESFWREKADGIKSKVGADASLVLRFATDPDWCRCMSSGDADVDLGLKVLGLGFGIGYDLKLKESGVMNVLGHRTFVHDESPYKSFSMLEVIKCSNGSPYRMVHFVMEEEGSFEGEPERRAKVWVEDVDGHVGARWSSSLQGPHACRKMIAIDGYETYVDALDYFESECAAGGGYPGTLEPHDRRVVNNIILTELAHYTHRPEAEPETGR
jgi:hypothetical protein